jgi:putative SOS response-associated peptidase YedK
MCGRYVSPDSASIERQWKLERGSGNPFPAHYNVSPGSEVPFLHFHGGKLLGAARWGLIPGWWKQDKPPRLSHNARSEGPALIEPLAA